MWAILDTSVDVGRWERGLYEETLAEVRKAFVIRHSAVVLSELRRGSRTREAERTVSRLQELSPGLWEPRGHGATVVTANRGDFEILGKRLGVPVLFI